MQAARAALELTRRLPACCPHACRCFAQLSVLGYILVPIFAANRWWLTLLYALFMLAVAAVEAVSRPAQTYPGMLLQARRGAAGMRAARRAALQRSARGESAARLHSSSVCPPRRPLPVAPPQVLGALGLAGSVIISYGLALVVQVSPWYDPQASAGGVGEAGRRAGGVGQGRLGHVAPAAAVRWLGIAWPACHACSSAHTCMRLGTPAVPISQSLIPMLGMLLGNACSGVAVGLSTILDELSAGAGLRRCGSAGRGALLRRAMPGERRARRLLPQLAAPPCAFSPRALL